MGDAEPTLHGGWTVPAAVGLQQTFRGGVGFFPGRRGRSEGPPPPSLVDEGVSRALPHLSLHQVRVLERAVSRPLPVRVLNDRQIDTMAMLRREGHMTHNEAALYDTVLALRAEFRATKGEVARLHAQQVTTSLAASSS